MRVGHYSGSRTSFHSSRGGSHFHSKGRGGHSGTGSGNSHQQQSRGRNNNSTCGYYGRQPHRSKLESPARGKVCRSCGKYGHFFSVCRQPRPVVNAVDEEKTYFLGAVDSDVPPWYVDVDIGKSAVLVLMYQFYHSRSTIDLYLVLHFNLQMHHFVVQEAR